MTQTITTVHYEIFENGRIRDTRPSRDDAHISVDQLATANPASEFEIFKCSYDSQAVSGVITARERLLVARRPANPYLAIP